MRLFETTAARSSSRQRHTSGPKSTKMPPTPQVSAWASYDQTAKTARRLQSTPNGGIADSTSIGESQHNGVPVRRQRHTSTTAGGTNWDSRHSAPDVNLNFSRHKVRRDILRDLEGGFRRSTATLLENQQRPSGIFLNFINQEGYDGADSSKDRSSEEEEDVIAPGDPSNEDLSEDKEFIVLDSEDVLLLRETFPTFFDTTSDQDAQPYKTISVASILSPLNATMPWVQDVVKSPWLLFADTCLRGIGQVYFQNSPFSGLLILIGLLLQSPTVAVHGLIALICASRLALGLGFDPGLAHSGLFGYNAVLVGLAVATFDADTNVNGTYSGWLILLAIIFACFTTIVFVMLGKLLVPYKSPPLTLPFVVSTIMFLLSTGVQMGRIEYDAVRPPGLPDYGASISDLAINGHQFMEGTLRGIGQVYFADNMASGALILAGIFVCSRISALAAFGGSALGAGVAVATGVPASQIQAGMYGFNASLSVTAMFMFYNPSIGTGFLSVFAGIMSVLAQQALASMLEPLGLPFMTLPFCITSLSFIIIQGTTSLVLAVPLADITVPEDHLKRINMLEDGMNFLKECVKQEETNQEQEERLQRLHNRKLQSSLTTISDANYDKEKAVDEDDGNASHRKSILSTLLCRSTPREQVIKSKAQKLFRLLTQKTKRPYLTIHEVLQTFRDAGLQDGEPTHVASVILHLTDHDGDKKIDDIEFVCFAMVAFATKAIRQNLFKFFDFVDVDGNGSIDFDEIDAALEYLGQSCLSDAERRTLVTLSNMENEEDEIETIELIDIVTLEKIKSLLSSH